ncbi:hypothetical protein BV25DRAFT_1842116 [Artomyces pyxidatus]|uniref:Uncharacterized protein n=1 Tax=Artomyces pyxidatus TaxID=48021 RepID=A0ACB8SJT1_9AGAM|nr:hypothetical protein BV25DRAFT_1842116 [Artomyces pyxidatus]
MVEEERRTGEHGVGRCGIGRASVEFLTIKISMLTANRSGNMRQMMITSRGTASEIFRASQRAAEAEYQGKRIEWEMAFVMTRNEMQTFWAELAYRCTKQQPYTNHPRTSNTAQTRMQLWTMDPDQNRKEINTPNARSSSSKQTTLKDFGFPHPLGRYKLPGSTDDAATMEAAPKKGSVSNKQKTTVATAFSTEKTITFSGMSSSLESVNRDLLERLSDNEEEQRVIKPKTKPKARPVFTGGKSKQNALDISEDDEGGASSPREVSPLAKNAPEPTHQSQPPLPAGAKKTKKDASKGKAPKESSPGKRKQHQPPPPELETPDNQGEEETGGVNLTAFDKLTRISAATNHRDFFLASLGDRGFLHKSDEEETDEEQQPVQVAAPAPTDYRVVVTAKEQYRTQVSTAGQEAFCGYAFDRIVGEGDKEPPARYKYGTQNSRPLKMASAKILAHSFVVDGRLMKDHPIPIAASRKQLDFTLLQKDKDKIQTASWLKPPPGVVFEQPLALSGQHRREGIRIFSEDGYSALVTKRRQVASVEKRIGKKAKPTTDDMELINRVKDELATIEKEYIEMTIWVVAVYDIGKASVHHFIRAHHLRDDILRHLGTNEILYHLPASQNELMVNKIFELQKTIKRKGVDIPTYMKDPKAMQDFVSQKGTNKSRDGLDNILGAPDYVEMLVGLAEYGKHFYGWEYFNPKFWAEVLKGTFGSMVVEAVEMAELPWRAILRVPRSEHSQEILDAASVFLADPSTTRERAAKAMEILLDIAYQPRAPPQPIPEDPTVELPPPLHDFRVVDHELYSDLAAAYQNHYQDCALAFLTHSELDEEEEAQWQAYRTAVLTALASWRERALPHIPPEDTGLLDIVNRAGHTTNFVFDNFHHLHLLKRVPFLNKYFIEDLKTILSGCKEGLREVFRWVDGSADIQLVTLNRNSLMDYSRISHHAFQKAGLSRVRIQYRARLNTASQFFCSLLKYADVELKHLSAHLSDPMNGFMETTRLTAKEDLAAYLVEEAPSPYFRRLLGPAAQGRSVEWYTAAIACMIQAHARATRPDVVGNATGASRKSNTASKPTKKVTRSTTKKPPVERSDSSTEDGYDPNKFDKILPDRTDPAHYVPRPPPHRELSLGDAQRYFVLSMPLGAAWRWDSNTKPGGKDAILIARYVTASALQTLDRHLKLRKQPYIDDMFADLTQAVNYLVKDKSKRWESWIDFVFRLRKQKDPGFAGIEFVAPEDMPLLTVEAADTHYAEASRRLIIASRVQAAYNSVTKNTDAKPLWVDIVDKDAGYTAIKLARQKDADNRNAQPGNEKLPTQYVTFEAHCAGLMAATAAYNNILRRREHLVNGTDVVFNAKNVPSNYFKVFDREHIIVDRKTDYNTSSDAGSDGDDEEDAEDAEDAIVRNLHMRGVHLGETTPPPPPADGKKADGKRMMTQDDNDHMDVEDPPNSPGARSEQQTSGTQDVDMEDGAGTQPSHPVPATRSKRGPSSPPKDQDRRRRQRLDQATAGSSKASLIYIFTRSASAVFQRVSESRSASAGPFASQTIDTPAQSSRETSPDLPLALLNKKPASPPNSSEGGESLEEMDWESDKEVDKELDEVEDEVEDEELDEELAEVEAEEE